MQVGHPIGVSSRLSQTLAKNLKWLMAQAGEDQVILARRSGVPQRTISTVLHARVSPQLRTVEALAAAYRLPAWALLVDDDPERLGLLQRLPPLIDRYLHVSETTRAYIDEVAEQSPTYRR